MEKGMQADLNWRLIAEIKRGTHVAVDGLRHPLDYESLKNNFTTRFHLWFIETSPIKRWERKKVQSRYATLNAFEAADAHPVEQRIESLQGRATQLILNEGSLQEFYDSLDEAIGSLGVRLI
jgi:dephospho-CoA kinase